MALAANRSYGDFSGVYSDLPDPMALEIIKGLTNEDRSLIFVTGRPDIDDCRTDTERWIRDVAQLPIELLLMRDANDHSPDTEVKRWLYREHIAGSYCVDLVLEDKPSVVNMWRQEGLRCYEVANNEY